MSFAKLIYEEIPHKNKGRSFRRARYIDFEIIIMKENGFINATAICKQGNKDYKEWSKNQWSKNLMIKLASLEEKSPSELSILVNGGQCTEICGTYVHPDVITHVANWVSIDFAIRVNKIVHEHVFKEHKDKLKEQRYFERC